MNRTSTVKTNSIAENCRLILRARCYTQQTQGFGTFSQQKCPPCHTLPTNPIYSPYGVDTLPGISSTITSNGFARHPSCIDGTIAPMQPILNQQTSHVQYLSIPSENCIQMITNAIVKKIRYKISQEEIALLCSCLPSLIRQIMCKSPWLTPNDVIQWLSADIIKEAMKHVDEDDKDTFHSHTSKERLTEKQQDNLSSQSHENDNDSLSSYRSTSSQESMLSQHSSRSILKPPINIHKKQNKSAKNEPKKKNENQSPSSTHSFSSRQSNDQKLSNHSSIIRSPQGTENKNEMNPIHIEEDGRSVSSRNNDSYLSTNTVDSNENFDQKSVELTPKIEADNQSPRNHIEYPGKKDPNAIQDVKKCLAFYHKIREYFDDDVAATLLKCCLCYGDCSGKR